MRNLILFFCLFSLQISAQTKLEKEIRVKDKDVPTKALDCIQDNIKSKKRVKWFFQKDADKEVYEAKFKQFGKKFSVEFLTSGEIFNVEIIIKKSNFKNQVYKAITSEMDWRFDDFKMIKIQTEYLGDDDDLEDIIEDYEIDDDLEQRFEIEVNAKTDGKRHLYEMIFDDNGKLLSKRKIKLKSTDILDY